MPVGASAPMLTWVIKDFKSVQDPKVIESPEFESGGCKWCVMFYPKGVTGHLSMSMYMAVVDSEDKPPGWKIDAKVWLSIESQSERMVLDGEEIRFDAECPKWGMSNWFRLHKPKDCFLDLHGDLKIEAHVEVVHKSRV
ncbi:unnamed protein product [Microthlaspi erraticum]|uniref:MATH domain-containing protein n=1 Tax=Microthlaspi erraticum TaxID=1685480 RepID=A0A6D2KJL6_9BRAS|nr:unnamed protein product [Microthlaspi erraticum]